MNRLYIIWVEHRSQVRKCNKKREEHCSSRFSISRRIGYQWVRCIIQFSKSHIEIYSISKIINNFRKLVFFSKIHFSLGLYKIHIYRTQIVAGMYVIRVFLEIETKLFPLESPEIWHFMVGLISVVV